MGQFKDKKTICKLLKEAILQLCKVSVGLNSSFTIDGIICIAQGESENQEVVVKIHEKIQERETNFDGPSVSQNVLGGVKKSTVVSSQLESEINSPNLSTVNSTTQSSNQIRKSNSLEQNVGYTAIGKHLPVVDNDIEILDISTEKQLFGDLDNFSDIECMGYDFDDLSFNDVVIKPDPGNFGKSVRSYATSQQGDESSDEELKIETLKAGRVRKPHKGSYLDVHGAPVQVLSKEEFKRILKSEKLKRSRDKSPDFVCAQKVLKTVSDGGPLQMRQPVQSQSVPLQSQVDIPRTIIGSLSYLPSQTMDVQNQFTRPSASIIRHHQTQLSQVSGVHQLHNDNTNSVSDTLPKQIQSEPSVKSVLPLVRQQVPFTKQHLVTSCVTQKFDHIKTSTSGVTIQNVAGVLNASNSPEMLPKNQNIPSSASHLNVRTSDTQRSNPQLFQVSQTVYRESPTSLLLPVQNKSNNSQPVGESNTSNVANIICLDTFNEATKSKAHECPVCAEVFESFRHLDLHMYRLHPGMFLCPVCGKSFKQRSTRNRHIVALHSSEKNFTCHLCNVSFTRTDTLKKHFNIHHPGEEIPKRSFSYSKGIPLQYQVLGLVKEQTNTDVNQPVYGEGIITPIQVTAALETNECSLSDIMANSNNITNITPSVNNELFLSSDPSKQNDVVLMTSAPSTSTSVSESQRMISSQNNNLSDRSDGRSVIMQSVIAPTLITSDCSGEVNLLDDNEKAATVSNKTSKENTFENRCLGTSETVSSETVNLYLNEDPVSETLAKSSSLNIQNITQAKSGNQDITNIENSTLERITQEQDSINEKVSQCVADEIINNLSRTTSQDDNAEENTKSVTNSVSYDTLISTGSTIEISDEETNDLVNGRNESKIS